VSKPLSIVFAGTPEFARCHLQALLESEHRIVGVLTQPDRPSGRGKKVQHSPVKALAIASGLPLQQPNSLRNEDDRAALHAWAPDVMVVVAYGLLLPQSVLDIPAYGCLNVHGSLLPRWRGAAPIQRAIEMGDRDTGITIMQMDKGLDTGAMLSSTSFPLEDTMTSGEVFQRMATLGPTLLLDTLMNLDVARARAEAQDESLAIYAEKINKAECNIPWEENATVIARRIRAFNPSPMCFSFLGDLRIKVVKARNVDAPQGGQDPGIILRADRDGIVVACGDGALAIETAQFPNAKPLPANELINGRKQALAPGNRFASEPS
jgi:methionyl-tRNA formyltransferase